MMPRTTGGWRVVCKRSIFHILSGCLLQYKWCFSQVPLLQSSVSIISTVCVRVCMCASCGFKQTHSPTQLLWNCFYRCVYLLPVKLTAHTYSISSCSSTRTYDLKWLQIFITHCPAEYILRWVSLSLQVFSPVQQLCIISTVFPPIFTLYSFISAYLLHVHISFHSLSVSVSVLPSLPSSVWLPFTITSPIICSEKAILHLYAKIETGNIPKQLFNCSPPLWYRWQDCNAALLWWRLCVALMKRLANCALC